MVEEVKSPNDYVAQNQKQTPNGTAQEGSGSNDAEELENREWELQDYAVLCKRAIEFAIKYAQQVTDKTAKQITDEVKVINSSLPKLAERVLEKMRETPFLSKRLQNQKNSWQKTKQTLA